MYAKYKCYYCAQNRCYETCACVGVYMHMFLHHSQRKRCIICSVSGVCVYTEEVKSGHLCDL